MKKCVICGQQFEKSEFYPFCSMRCKNVDLNRWFSEVYFVPEKVTDEKNNENSAGQSTEINLYEKGCPDSSVGRAED